MTLTLDRCRAIVHSSRARRVPNSRKRSCRRVPGRRGWPSAWEGRRFWRSPLERDRQPGQHKCASSFPEEETSRPRHGVQQHYHTNQPNNNNHNNNNKILYFTNNVNISPKIIGERAAAISCGMNHASKLLDTNQCGQLYLWWRLSSLFQVDFVIISWWPLWLGNRLGAWRVGHNTGMFRSRKQIMTSSGIVRAELTATANTHSSS